MTVPGCHTHILQQSTPHIKCLHLSVLHADRLEHQPGCSDPLDDPSASVCSWPRASQSTCSAEVGPAPRPSQRQKATVQGCGMSSGQAGLLVSNIRGRHALDCSQPGGIVLGMFLSQNFISCPMIQIAHGELASCWVLSCHKATLAAMSATAHSQMASRCALPCALHHHASNWVSWHVKTLTCQLGLNCKRADHIMQHPPGGVTFHS